MSTRRDGRRVGPGGPAPDFGGSKLSNSESIFSARAEAGVSKLGGTVGL